MTRIFCRLQNCQLFQLIVSIDMLVRHSWTRAKCAEEISIVTRKCTKSRISGWIILFIVMGQKKSY
ncbi:hypothetical protein HYPBUDRAFT_152484 [Hyphopichia burtonii NRRL Y-1933]|uniref:Uncharacterized protein n=1 Tax=Hyphopichia burtonii NRRL Y-1933 TaxID=984485 RepID=A0A1E4RK87_9ASCO|nr:hypothetical protein HYPBUDRAFT_152484 [Hyphopichia burtonii NRRL Y-1933]ODV67621.1 hypothetical protein HYPBUDRAFT_152484 [Hyphopichia burtonii NRRL Y-1933]